MPKRQYLEAREVTQDQIEHLAWQHRDTGESIQLSCSIATFRTPDGIVFARISRAVR